MIYGGKNPNFHKTKALPEGEYYDQDLYMNSVIDMFKKLREIWVLYTFLHMFMKDYLRNQSSVSL